MVSLKEESEIVFLKVDNHGRFINPEQREKIFIFINREHENARKESTVGAEDLFL